MDRHTRVTAVVTAVALAGALGLAAAQTPINDDVINRAAEQGAQRVDTAPRNPAQLEVDNGNKVPGTDRAAMRAPPAQPAPDTTELPPKADRN